eukprot:2254510-Amphidinium_carterae.1
MLGTSRLQSSAGYLAQQGPSHNTLRKYFYISHKFNAIYKCSLLLFASKTLSTNKKIKGQRHLIDMTVLLYSARTIYYVLDSKKNGRNFRRNVIRKSAYAFTVLPLVSSRRPASLK